MPTIYFPRMLVVYWNTWHENNCVWRGAGYNYTLQWNFLLRSPLRSGHEEFIFCQLQTLTTVRLGNVPCNFQRRYFLRTLDLLLLESTLCQLKLQNNALLLLPLAMKTSAQHKGRNSCWFNHNRGVLSFTVTPDNTTEPHTPPNWVLEKVRRWRAAVPLTSSCKSICIIKPNNGSISSQEWAVILHFKENQREIYVYQHHLVMSAKSLVPWYWDLKRKFPSCMPTCTSNICDRQKYSLK